ncbi:hypothetical protein Q8F57_003395 [Paraburkholderia terrae]|uniref:hypothetical protein n=1 Tax=Paraburkholderia terrae TaxID=311230 RepID=UPI00296AD126|nr:hypothetical protein [Paraburkholderia terrae]MDW3655429.1 hypothetical protein [Paraburkholderia terrae]
MSLAGWMYLSFLVIGAAAWVSVRVAAKFDAALNSTASANNGQVHSEARSRRAFGKGQ